MLGLRLFCVYVLVVLPGIVSAQGTEGPSGEGEPGAGLEMPVDPETYVLGPLDGVYVSLKGRINYMYRTRITLEGELFLKTPVSPISIGASGTAGSPVDETLDQIQVSGLTLAEAEKKTNEAASRYFKGVQVFLNLANFRRCKVFVVGDVFRPGVFNANPVTRVSEVVNRAQLQGTASRAHIELIRGDTVHSIVNLYDFEITGDPSGNPYLRDGDIIRVPSMKKRVTVRGAVYGSGVYTLRISALTAEQTRISEGIYELEDGDKASDMVRKAGGLAPWADLKNSYVERQPGAVDGKRKISVDLEKVLIRGDASTDVLMEDGDILIIPSLEDVVYVEGAITAPGAIQYQPGLGFMGYIGQAGGPTDRAAMGQVRIKRPDGRTIAAKGNPEIRRGDTIVVPEVGLKWWQDYLAITTAVTSLVIAWLTISR
ncbi:MAG: SLBB domain-containing protein [bacterium]